MKRVLLTGATGFIGRHAIAPLAGRGFEVHAISSRPHAPSSDVREWHLADLLVPGEAARVVDAIAPTHLLHFAWIATPGQFWTSSENTRWVKASTALVDAFASRGGQRVVGAGTCAEYAVSEEDCDELRTPLNPSTLYGRSKREFSMSMEAAATRHHALSTAWGRIFHLYGPGEALNRLVPSVTIALLDRRPALCTSGIQLRDFLHVQDVASAFVALLDSDVRGAVNIASGDPLTIAELVEKLARQLDGESLVRLGALTRPSGDPNRLTANVARLRHEVAWQPQIGLDSGIATAIDWWRSERQKRTRSAHTK